MDIELSEISTFVQAIPPFDALPVLVINKLVREINISYLRAGTKLPPKGDDVETLYLLRKGALNYLASDKELLAKYGEGDLCTVFCSTDSNTDITVLADEDTLLYGINYQLLQNILADFPEVCAFFHQNAAERLSHKMTQVNDEAILASSLSNTSVADFYHSPAATISSKANIQEAAVNMTSLGFSSLIVIDNNLPIGIVTDKDIRRRCVAQGLDIHQSISEIMTTSMLTIDIKSSAYDALMIMTSKHIHHLPVISHGELVGMVTITDLMHQEGQNALNITSLIHKATTISELAEISLFVPKLQVKMAKLGTTADHIGKSISAITMAFTIRLIEMAEKLQGPAPVPFAWLAAGSQARQEQFAHSDQDNALIISNQLKPEHDYWFHDLATFVSDGLAACGFIYCPGDVMATNKKWRQSQVSWDKYFDKWITIPDPKSLMLCSIFFDLTTVYGDESLLNDIQKSMLEKTQQSSLFIAHLSRNALQLKPPLGFFRDFVLIQNGKHKASIDLKHNGIAPIVDLARIFALSEGIKAVNTIERLKQAAGTPSLTKASSENLIDAYEFLNMLRMEHQAKQLQAGLTPDNYLTLKEISRLERQHLKDAFKVIKTIQDNRQAIYS